MKRSNKAVNDLEELLVFLLQDIISYQNFYYHFDTNMLFWTTSINSSTIMCVVISAIYKYIVCAKPPEKIIGA